MSLILCIMLLRSVTYVRLILKIEGLLFKCCVESSMSR